MREEELIEAFWIQQGGKANMPEDLWFYRSSWDMLIPVVEKINSLNYTVQIFPTRVKIFTTSTDCIESIHPGYSLLEVTYCAVVEFIKWYNQQNQ